MENGSATNKYIPNQTNSMPITPFQVGITTKLFHVFVTGTVKDASALHSALLFILSVGN